MEDVDDLLKKDIQILKTRYFFVKRMLGATDEQMFELLIKGKE